ncbi:MAG: hypothetical protein F2795_08385 [Actinobacteria bacterium]|nr:hypothetical protein [Actinomycetota bacterium]
MVQRNARGAIRAAGDSSAFFLVELVGDAGELLAAADPAQCSNGLRLGLERDVADAEVAGRLGVAVPLLEVCRRIARRGLQRLDSHLEVRDEVALLVGQRSPASQALTGEVLLRRCLVGGAGLAEIEVVPVCDLLGDAGEDQLAEREPRLRPVEGRAGHRRIRHVLRSGEQGLNHALVDGVTGHPGCGRGVER